MDESKLWALQIHHKDLVKDLRVEDIQDHMIFSGIMDEDDFEKISNLGKSRKERAGFFLDDIKRKGPAAFGHFCDALHESKQGYLSKQLKDCAEMLAKKKGRGSRIEVDATTLQAILRKNDLFDKEHSELQQLRQQNEELQRKIDKLIDGLTRERKRSAELAEDGETLKNKHDESMTNMTTLLQVVRQKEKHADLMEQDVEGLEENLYNMEERLNIKEETIKSLQHEKRQAEGNLIQEHRMVNNFKGQLESSRQDMQLLKQDLIRVRGERSAARKAADERGAEIKKLEHELMISTQLKKNCLSVIQHLNGSVQSKENEAKQAHTDLSCLLQQYIDLKQTVS